MTITWICDICHGPVSGTDGILHIQPWRTAERPGVDDPDTWHVHHWACMPADRMDDEGYTGDYSFDVGQAETREQIAHWTRHLAAKTWYPVSGWQEMVQRATGVDVADDARRELMYAVDGKDDWPAFQDRLFGGAR